jgi:hypothetical protein
VERGEVFSVPLTYNTIPAFANRIDATDLGRSLRGIGRLSNLVVHALFTGDVPERRTNIEIRFYVGPPISGSIRYDLAAILGSAQLPIWWDAFCLVSKPLFEYLLAAVLHARLGRDREKERMLDIIHDQIARADVQTTLVQLGHMQDKAWLQGLVEKLVERRGAKHARCRCPGGQV